ncbi:uncharacterized protein [Drosophila bipectinata]|uniref:uncharacterized protein n=1 Tax=Drosophila bipectinata TaxID=42026 RepID=UPI0038B32E90
MDGRTSSEPDDWHPDRVTLRRRKSCPSEGIRPLERNQDTPLRRSESEPNLDSNVARGLVALQSVAQQGSGDSSSLRTLGSSEEPGDSSSLRTLDARPSTTSGFGISVTESQTSGYTTESSYQTPTGYALLSESSSYASIGNHHGLPPSNFQRDIHVPIDIPPTEEETQSIHENLRDLLTTELALISQDDASVVYLIAYHYM